MGKSKKEPSGCPWSNVYLVRIRRIDDQHKGLFFTLNALHSALLNQGNLNQVDKFLTDLIRQTKVHFCTEEELMQSYSYPDYENHKHIHDLLLQQVEDLQTAQQALGVQHLRQHWIERQEVADFLSMWLVDHIKSEDKKLGAFLQGREVK